MRHLLVFLVACQAAPLSPTEAPPAELNTSLAINVFDPQLVKYRVAQGRLAETEEGADLPRKTLEAAPKYFMPYPAVIARMQTIADTFPNQAQLIALGASREGSRQVMMLRLGSGTTKVLIYAGEHSREIANPAMLLRWVERLLSSTDAEALAFLQTRQIDVIPLLNPDGHAVVERGFSGGADGDTWHRKTTRPPDGVDPNRNFPFRWGGPGASTYETAQDYRGPSAGSEPEVMTLRALSTAEHYPIAIDFHSYSRLNLWPWGDTQNATPDATAFAALGFRFARDNGYSPMQSIHLYPTSGTSIDGLYGEQGTMAFVIETGDDFLQTDEQYEETCRENLPVIDYAIRIAPDPKHLVFGAEVRAPSVSNGVLTATAEDLTQHPAAVKAAEVVTDANAAPGSGIALRGTFNAASVTVSGAAPAHGYVRAQSASGQWGPLLAY